MNRRIIRGVRIATPEGMRAASVHVADGVIVAIAGYDDIPRTTIPEELGKGVLMPGLVQFSSEENTEDGAKAAAAGGITTLVLAGELPVPTSLLNLVSVPNSDEEPVSNLPTLLCRTWTAMRNRGESVESIVETLCSAPARAAGIASRTGSLKVGMHADFVVWHPEYTVVGATELLYGQVRHTIVRGRTVYKDGWFEEPVALGRTT